MKKIALVLLAMVMLIVVPCLAFDPYQGPEGLIPLCQNNKTGVFRFAPTKDIDPSSNKNYQPHCNTRFISGTTTPTETLVWIDMKAFEKPRANPLQIALLRWYEANETGIQFSVGNNPTGIAFDGANIWVTNYNDNNVTKLRASDGANLGTFDVGNTPTAIAFDGANIWVTNSNSNNVTRLRASDGANLGHFAVGKSPSGIAFDGDNIWVTSWTSNNVTKLQASNGLYLGTFDVGSYPTGIASDGANIWVVNSISHNVTKLRASDGSNLGTFATGLSPREVAFDGASIWVTNSGSNSVSKL